MPCLRVLLAPRLASRTEWMLWEPPGRPASACSRKIQTNGGAGRSTDAVSCARLRRSAAKVCAARWEDAQRLSSAGQCGKSSNAVASAADAMRGATRIGPPGACGGSCAGAGGSARSWQWRTWQGPHIGRVSKALLGKGPHDKLRKYQGHVIAHQLDPKGTVRRYFLIAPLILSIHKERNNKPE